MEDGGTGGSLEILWWTGLSVCSDRGRAEFL